MESIPHAFDYWTGTNPTPPSTLPPEIAALFGPVTSSGYAQAPVDPLSYYSPQQPVAEPTPYTGGPTRWTEVYRPTPDLSIPETFSPVQTQPEQYTPSFVNQPTPSLLDQPTGFDIENQNYILTGEGFENTIANPNFKEPRVPPNPPRFGIPPVPIDAIDPVFDYDSWQWLDRRIKAPTTPPVPPGPDENVKEVTPEEAQQMIGDQTPVVPGQQGETVTPVKVGWTEKPYTVIQDIIRTNRPNLPPVPTYEFKDYVKPAESVTNRRPGTVTPFNMPTEIPIPPRRDDEFVPSGYFRDINYDPDEILAAAMRVINGRMAGRSIINDLRG
jgi:hypothetical protein